MLLRMYDTYIPKKSFIPSEFRDIMKIWKKINDIKNIKNIYFAL